MFFYIIQNFECQNCNFEHTLRLIQIFLLKSVTHYYIKMVTLKADYKKVETLR